MTKNSFRLWILALPIALALVSCAKNDNSVVFDQVTDVDPTSLNSFNPTVLAPIANVYFAPGVDDDLKQAFTWGTAAVSNDPAYGAILVLNKLTDVSEDVLKQVFEDVTGKGGAKNHLVCVVNPDKEELEAYKEAHNWIWFDTTNITDSTFIFGFNAADSHYFIIDPSDSENEDPVLANINRAQDYYVLISGMLTDFSSKMQASSQDDNDKNSMEDFAAHYHNSVTKRISVKKTFRELLWSDPDVHEGSFTLTANYDIYMVHVYEGEPGAGDYYGVKMTGSIASGEMWKGKGDNVHGGTHLRWCGAYCKGFYVESHLVAPPNNDYTSDYIMFTSGGFPSPSTTINLTTYQDTNSFGLSMSQSIGGSQKTSTQGENVSVDKEKHFELKFSESWEWSHSETRYIKDVDIVNMTTNGNWAAWRLKFNNLPVYKYSESKGFDIKDNEAARGTMDIHCSWLWYDKNGKDNEDREPYTLRTWMSGDYEIQSFISTDADLISTSIQEGCLLDFKLPKMVNLPAGRLKIKNDLPDGMTLSNVKVITTDGDLVHEFENTVPNNGEEVLGAFNTNYQYIVTFKGRTHDGQTREYKYSLNPSIKLTHKAVTTIYANSDFTAQ